MYNLYIYINIILYIAIYIVMNLAFFSCIFMLRRKDIYYEKYAQYKNYKKVEENFSYSSGKNSKFLSVNELRELIEKDIYWHEGIWTSFDIYPWVQAF